MAGRILKEQLKEGDYLLIKAKARADNRFRDFLKDTPENFVKVIHNRPGGYVGVLVPGFRGGNDLEGRLSPPNHTAGWYFTMDYINLLFELPPSGMIPAKQKVDFNSVILADHKKEQIIHALNTLQEMIDYIETFKLKERRMGKVRIEIMEDGEWVWGGILDSELFNELLELANKLNDETFEKPAPTRNGAKE